MLFIAQNLPGDEPSAIQLWATAYDNFMAQSTAAAAPLNPAVAVVARAAMVGAMTGLSITAAASLTAGMLAYWGALNVPASYGANIAPTAPPPGLAGMAAALTPVFVANTAGGLSDVAATAALAAAMYPLHLGGTTTLVVPADTPIL